MGDFEGGAPPSWGDTRGLAPSVGVGEAGFRAEPATECGSNPIARSIPRLACAAAYSGSIVIEAADKTLNFV